jgi:ferrochelatase
VTVDEPPRRRVETSSPAGPPSAGVVLLNLGGPDSPQNVKPFLRELFDDPEVLKLPGGAPMRKLVGWLIVQARARQVAANYAEVGGSPLLARTLAQERALEAALGPRFVVRTAMRYSKPRAEQAVRELVAAGVDRVVALPLYPHECRATTGSSLTELREVAARLAPSVPLLEVTSYARDVRYVAALARCVEEGLAKARAVTSQSNANSNGAAAHSTTGATTEPVLLFSAHGLPLRIVRAGDRYLDEIHATIDAVLARLAQSPSEPFRGRHELSFQSRAGPVKWLEPTTLDTIARLASEGVRSIVVVPVSFVSDHIETVHEIDVLLAGHARRCGVTTFVRTPALDVRPDFVDALARLVVARLELADPRAPTREADRGRTAVA